MPSARLFDPAGNLGGDEDAELMPPRPEGSTGD